MNVKDSLLNTLAASGGEYISGAALAEKLKVSRNAVWKAVKSLEAEGYAIESVTSKGYRLAKSNNRLSEKLISAHLQTKALGRELQVLDEVDSTNIAAKKL
ncbi:MAG: HTH domain-containing protein, partial [Ruminococcus sp.]|nr:HTH domain-containing protein [Ruminococcus sp.]